MHVHTASDHTGLLLRSLLVTYLSVWPSYFAPVVCWYCFSLSVMKRLDQHRLRAERPAAEEQLRKTLPSLCFLCHLYRCHLFYHHCFLHFQPFSPNNPKIPHSTFSVVTWPHSSHISYPSLYGTMVSVFNLLRLSKSVLTSSAAALPYNQLL